MAILQRIIWSENNEIVQLCAIINPKYNWVPWVGIAGGKTVNVIVDAVDAKSASL